MSMSDYRSLRLALAGALVMGGLTACGQDKAGENAAAGTRNAVAVTVAEARRQEVRVELSGCQVLPASRTATRCEHRQ